MGFKMPKIKVPKIVKQVAGGPLLAQAGALQNAIVGKAPNAPNPGEDPTTTALRGRLFGEAEDFQKNLPGYQQDASNQIQKEGDMALESGVKGTRENFNRRGLLYSGMRQGAEQDVKGRVASTMASQKAQSNSDLTKLAAAKSEKAAQVGLQGYQQAVQREAEIEGIKLQSQVARAQVMQQLGQTGGQVAGAYYGSRNTQPSQQASQPVAWSGNDYSSNQYRNDNNLNIYPFGSDGRVVT